MTAAVTVQREGAAYRSISPTWRRIEAVMPRIRGLGDRVLVEILAELIARDLDETSLARLLEDYSQLDPTSLAALGGNHFPCRFSPVPSDRVAA